MNKPIIKGLKKYIGEKNLRFHMPGHKGKKDFLDWTGLIPQIDVTEVKGTDNLHDPKDIISRSQKIAAQVFEAKKTFYSINGTTSGIYAAITSATKPGDKILIQRDSHRSVYNACVLGRLNIKYVYSKYSIKNKILTGITKEDLDFILKENRDISTVVITYPSYYGVCCDIKSIADIVHSYGKLLIVDEAHGSHLKFCDELPISALEGGADIVIQSTHKTLPAFTQASMVHVCTNRVDMEKIKRMLSMFQSTSPSYILMASIDSAVDYIRKHGKHRLTNLVSNIKTYTSQLGSIDGVKIFNKSNMLEEGYDFDITKILINMTDKNITGHTLLSLLRDNYKIQLEMADMYHGLALSTLADDSKDIEKLCLAVEDIAKKVYKKDYIADINIEQFKPEIIVPLHEAFNKDTRVISLEKSKNEISGDYIIPFPPGVPILCPGEKITEDLICYIKTLKNNGTDIIGLKRDSNNCKLKIVNK